MLLGQYDPPPIEILVKKQFYPKKFKVSKDFSVQKKCIQIFGQDIFLVQKNVEGEKNKLVQNYWLKRIMVNR